MQIKVIGDNLEVTEDMKQTISDKLEDKLGKLLKTFAEDLKVANLKIHKLEKYDQFKVNFDMWLPGKKHIFADAESDNFVNAITELREGVESQIKEYKGKLSSH